MWRCLGIRKDLRRIKYNRLYAKSIGGLRNITSDHDWPWVIHTEEEQCAKCAERQNLRPVENDRQELRKIVAQEDHIARCPKQIIQRQFNKVLER